jgi:hypothetical protein
LHDIYLKGKIMNIIFGDAINDIPDSFTKLELDTVEIEGTGDKHTAWAVVENIPLHEFSTLAEYRLAHENLLLEYRAKNWAFCISAINALTGRWNGELDSFYQHLRERVEGYQLNPPPPDWDGTIFKKTTIQDSRTDL